MNPHLSVVHLPSLNTLSANPYWSILKGSLAELQVQSIDTDMAIWGKRWLIQNRNRADVLHFHYIQQFYAYEGTRARLRWVLRFAANLFLARILGYRTVFTLHNATPTYPLQPEWVDNLGQWFAVNLTDSVIVHCEAARQLLKKRFGRCKHVYTVPHPNFISQYPNTIPRSTARTVLALKPESLVFAFIGGIRPNKGIETLIAVFKQFAGADFNLLIAGKPWPPETYIQVLEQSAIEDPRILLRQRYIPDEELQVYFNAADVIVLPFARILTSGSAILAMSFGRPIVVPARGCLPELISENEGTLYDPALSDGLLVALKQCVAKRSELEQMGKRAQQSVARLTGELMAEQTLRAYRIGK